MAFYGWPISQCQSLATPLATQLQSGIRVIDIRLAVITTMSPSFTSSGITDTAPTPKYELVAYHGVFPQRTPFPTILQTIYTFLTSPEGSRETIVMSIKQEDYAITPTELFSRLVRETMMASPGGWSTSTNDTGMYFLQNRIPQLGEVRGKVVLFSRFGGDGAEWDGGLEGIGIHPTTWPDSEKEGFEWELKGTLVRTHDWWVHFLLYTYEIK
jgi:1-phosphatidylinositol phosphodiesterase